MDGERSRTNDAHVPFEDAEELRKLIEVELLHEVPRMSSAVRRPFRSVRVPISALCALGVDVLLLDQSDLVFRDDPALTHRFVTEEHRATILGEQEALDDVSQLDDQ